MRYSKKQLEEMEAQSKIDLKEKVAKFRKNLQKELSDKMKYQYSNNLKLTNDII